MKIILVVNITVKGRSHALMRKEKITNILPLPGIKIMDLAWKNPKLPTDVSCDLDDESYYLKFKSENFNSNKEGDECILMYESHGWERPRQ